MKKNKIITSASMLFNIVLISSIGLLIAHGHINLKNIFSYDQQKTEKTFNVAITLPVTHPSLEKIKKGFIQTLEKEKDMNIAFTEYNANGNRTLLRGQAEEVVAKNFDLIFTIGATCTQIAKETATKKGVNIPIVFGAVSNPEKLGILDTPPSLLLTGAQETRNIPLQLNLLLHLKPTTKHLTLAYNPAQDPQLDKDKQEVEQFCKEKGINFVSIEVYDVNEIKQKVSPMLDQTEVLLILKDNTMVSGLESLTRLCERSHVTLYASDLDSPDGGAALGFGVPEKSFGITAAQLARQLLKEGKKARKLPIKLVDDFHLKVNKNVLVAQNLPLDTYTLFLIEKGIV